MSLTHLSDLRIGRVTEDIEALAEDDVLTTAQLDKLMLALQRGFALATLQYKKITGEDYLGEIPGEGADTRFCAKDCGCYGTRRAMICRALPHCPNCRPEKYPDEIAWPSNG